jgi:hypothetical protein
MEYTSKKIFVVESTSEALTRERAMRPASQESDDFSG